jgi:hypothetical protein
MMIKMKVFFLLTDGAHQPSLGTVFGHAYMGNLFLMYRTLSLISNHIFFIVKFKIFLRIFMGKITPPELKKYSAQGAC